ncbi:SRPBCC domain-containing protein [Nocardiopsis ansamitocini]|uniref:Activator of Hsp90 ATPase homologue 1/2-like C-terminal domain-containing protein n=1 Tax=Nocardiopsis ansamitocini TaxID=1670832 RepID=A0A9W6UJ57_9ACTN|nr:SRPBCC domain-containing protein [Nocardiopsis ansamitocini]GLU48392.1 hypothetical protein Nans01_27430 [Nocardiopsis ansamitocini]
MTNVVRATAEGRCELRMERRFPHPPRKVWRALTESAHLSRWYPFPVRELELAVGGTISFDDGQGGALSGVVTVLDPPGVFAFSEQDDLLRFELHSDGPDGCLLVFTHVFDDSGHSANNTEGWQKCLAVLGEALAQDAEG